MAGRGSSFGQYMLSSMSRGKFVNILHSTCIFGYMQGNMKASEAKLLDDRQLICSHFRHLCMQMDPNPPFWNLNAYMRITLKKHPIVPLKSIIRDNLHLPLLLPRSFFQLSIFCQDTASPILRLHASFERRGLLDVSCFVHHFRHLCVPADVESECLHSNNQDKKI